MNLPYYDISYLIYEKGQPREGSGALILPATETYLTTSLGEKKCQYQFSKMNANYAHKIKGKSNSNMAK